MPLRRIPPACFATVLVFAAGCTTARDRTLARYERDGEPFARPAPEGGLYKVKWAAARDENPQTVADSKRLVAKGELIGFLTGADGRVVAVAGPQQFPLDQAPARARFYAWSYRVERHSPLRAGLTAAGKGLGTLGDVTLGVGMKMLEAYTGGDPYPEQKPRRHGRQHRPSKAGDGESDS